MRKVVTFLFLSLFVFAATAHARVCFLPHVFGGKETCLSDQEYAVCKGFDRSTPCPNGQEQVSCVNSKNGRTYYKCYCRADMVNLMDHPEYTCRTGYTEQCGCAVEHLECSPEYKYEGDGLGHCKGYINSEGVGACVLPNGEVWYKDCQCNSKYSFTCKETGLQYPGDEFACVTPGGLKYYSQCDCASGWSVNCGGNKKGCTRPMTSVYGNAPKDTNSQGSGWCYKCEEYVCRTTDLINMSAYYCEFLENVNFDCQKLGYTYAPTGYCPEGTKNAGMTGAKCPYGRDYMVCEDEDMPYLSKESCEAAVDGSICSLGAEGWYLSGCKTNEGYEYVNGTCKAAPCPAGYRTNLTETNCTGEYTLQAGTQKSAGEICKKCVCTPQSDCIYSDHQVSESGIIYAGQALLTDRCCNGYYKTCENQCPGGSRSYDTDLDENAMEIEKCQSCGEEYYTIKACKNGYALRGNECVSTTCDASFGYGAVVKNVNNCKTSDGLYEGAYGWKFDYQTTSSGYQQNGDDACTKCICDVADECKWDDTNKGPDGSLHPSDICCNGKYKNCYADTIPAEATTSACNDENAEDITEYKACDFGKYCIINSCKNGKQPVSNSCVEDEDICGGGDNICEENTYENSDCGGLCALGQACVSNEGTTCPYQCECLNAQGFYDTCPVEAVCESNETCQHVTGCAGGYVQENECAGVWSQTFDYGSVKCGVCTECNASEGDYLTCPKEAVCEKIGVCQHVTGCGSPYVEDSACLNEFDEVAVFGDIHCGNCTCGENEYPLQGVCEAGGYRCVRNGVCYVRNGCKSGYHAVGEACVANTCQNDGTDYTKTYNAIYNSLCSFVAVEPGYTYTDYAVIKANTNQLCCGRSGEKLICDYYTKQACESANTGFSCADDGNGCFVKNGCKTGYHPDGTSCVENTCSDDGTTNTSSRTNPTDGACPTPKWKGNTDYTVAGPNGTIDCCDVGLTVIDRCLKGTYKDRVSCEADCSNGRCLCLQKLDGKSDDSCPCTCDQGGVYEPGDDIDECTASKYNALKRKAIIAGYSINTCTSSTSSNSGSGIGVYKCRKSLSGSEYGDKCTTHYGLKENKNDLDGYYHYEGAFDDGCLTLTATQEGDTATSTRRDKCIAALTAVDNEVSAWNTKCPDQQIDIYWYHNSITDNCQICVINGGKWQACSEAY